MKLLSSWCVLCTPYNHAPCHFMQSHIHKVHVCLAVTCHLHFWQNDRGLLRATAVMQGWNGYRNKSQHRKSTLEKKILLPLLLWFEPATVWSGVHSCMHVLIFVSVHIFISLYVYLCLAILIYIYICLSVSEEIEAILRADGFHMTTVISRKAGRECLSVLKFSRSR